MGPTFYRRLSVVALAAALAASSSAQPGPPRGLDRSVPTAATLPESNEATLLTSRIEEAISHGDYRLGIELVEQMLRLPGELVAAPGSRTYYPVWRHALRLLAQLPDAGVQTFRQLRDAEIASRLTEAARSGDDTTLSDLFRTSRLSTSWEDAGRTLASLQLERGAYGAAVETLRELTASTPPSFDRSAQLVVAMAGLDAWRSAEDLLARLASDVANAPDPRLRARVESLSAWLRAERESRRVAAAELDPILAPPSWTLQLTLREFDSSAATSEIDLAVNALRRLPLHRPVVAEGALVVRLGGNVMAFDALALIPRWQVREIDASGETRDLEMAAKIAWMQAEQPATREFSQPTRTLLTHALRHAVSVGGGLVFSVEGLTLPDQDPGDALPPALRGAERVYSNELVARDLRTGQLRWRTGEDVGGKLFGVAFQDAPLTIGSRLLAAYQRRDELWLGEIDPRSGALLREVSIVGAPTHFTPQGGRCQLACDETSVFVATGNGVIAAVARDDLRWKWATVYPSTLAEHIGRLWWQPDIPPLESGVDGLVICDDLLIAAPMDTQDVIALDRFSGRERWRRPRGVNYYMVGAVGRGLIVGGETLVCVNLSDGETVLWRSVPLDVIGGPVLRDQTIYVPTGVGIVALDAVTGKVTRDAAIAEPAPGDSPLSNSASEAESLVVTGDAIFGVTPRRVTKYPDVSATRAQCSTILSGTGGDFAGAQIALAWLDVLSGKDQDAFHRLERLADADPAHAAARDRLLATVFVSLARSGGDVDEKLRWLREAAKLTNAPEAAMRVGLMVAAALQEAGRSGEALTQYLKLVADRRGAALVDRATGSRQAAWLAALRPARALLIRLSPDEVSVALDSALATLRGAAADETAAALQRLRLLCGEAPGTQTLLTALATQTRLAPELLVHYLPSRNDPTKHDANLALRIWDTHVALGLLDQARLDAEVWRAAAGTALDADTRERVEQIELAMRKLEQHSGPPLARSITRQWRTADAEMLVDRRAISAGVETALLRRLEDRQISLTNVLTGGALRDTPDTLSLGAAGEAAVRDAAAAAVGLRRENAAAERDVWPMVRHESLAAVPVRGGLVCVGLGPERGGGQRLWETPLPEWQTIPGLAAQRLAAGAYGAYVSTRETRIDCYGWIDGKPLWQFDSPGTSIGQIVVAGEDLVVVTADHEVLVLDAFTGEHARRIPPELGTPRRVEVVSDTLIICGADFVCGLDPHDFSRRWSRPSSGVTEAYASTLNGLFSYSELSGVGWTVVDARSGATVGPNITQGDLLEAIGRNGDQIVLAFRARSEQRNAASAELVAFGSSASDVSWTRDVPNAGPINDEQLSVNPEFLPILLVAGPDISPESEHSALAIGFVERRDGAMDDPTPIGRHFRKHAAFCGPYLHVTPTRLVVQAVGNVIAFGAVTAETQP
ncbi:MAG: PQQ-binding-like beta-propeller repeat protein [Phycisphaerae bacterium]